MIETRIEKQKKVNHVKNKKRKSCNLITLLMLLAIVITSMPSYNVSAKEKAYKTITTWVIDWEINGYQFIWRFKSGPTTLLVKKNGKEKKLVANDDLGLSLVTNGSKIYYFTYHYETQKANVYKMNIDGSKKTKVFSVKAKKGFDLAGLVGGKLYYKTGSEHGNLHYYTLKTKKHKVVIKDIERTRYKKNHFLLETICDDNTYRRKISAYSVKTKKVKTISKNVYNYEILGNKIYYVEYKSAKKTETPSGINTVTVKKCNLNGKNKKTLIKKLSMQRINELKANSITYTNKAGKEVTKKY